MSAAQWFAVAALAVVGLACLGGMLYVLATEIVREHFQRAGVRFDRHVDDALEVTR